MFSDYVFDNFQWCYFAKYLETAASVDASDELNYS